MTVIDAPENAPQLTAEVSEKLSIAKAKKEVGDQAFKSGDLKGGKYTLAKSVRMPTSYNTLCFR